MGLDISLVISDVEDLNMDNDQDVKDIEIKSTLHPDHYCNIGYFRSSYNSGGFNLVINSALEKDGFYYLFDYDNSNPNQNYYFQPDWNDVKSRAVSMLHEYTEYVNSNDGVYKSIFDGPNPYLSIDDLKQNVPDGYAALSIFKKELNNNSQYDGSYSNSNGHFYFDKSIKVHGLIPGFQFGNVGVHVIYKLEKEYALQYKSIIEIVIETCDYVLNHNESDKIWVGWSA